MKQLMSRAKREGCYCGHYNGKSLRTQTRCRILMSTTSGYYVPTRKARKLAAIECLNSTRQGTFGGHIN